MGGSRPNPGRNGLGGSATSSKQWFFAMSADARCWLLSPKRKLHYIADPAALKLLADALPKDKSAAQHSDLKALVGTYSQKASKGGVVTEHKVKRARKGWPAAVRARCSRSYSSRPAAVSIGIAGNPSELQS